MRIYALIIVAIGFLSSCGKDEPLIPEEYLTGNVPVSDTTRGNSMGTYMPVTKGTTWTYVESSTLDGTELTRTSTCTGRSIKKGDENYFELISKNQGSPLSDTSYISSSNNKYVMYGHAASTDDILKIDFLHSDATKDVEWVSSASLSGSVNGIDGRIVGVVKEKGMTIKVKGKEYKNVIHSFLELQYDYYNGWETFAYYDVYTAKGIGIVKIDTRMDAIGITMTFKSELKSYSIAK